MKTLYRNQRHQIPELLAVSRRAGKAIMDYRMIEAGDKIAAAVSGGKDSISLLHVLRHRQRVSPVKFEFTAVHIDFEFADFNPQKLIDYLAQQDFPYIIEKTDSLKEKTSNGRRSTVSAGPGTGARHFFSWQTEWVLPKSPSAIISMISWRRFC